MSSLRMAAGSVLGREHARLGKSCQDAFAVRRDGERIVAVVTDGCGSARRSDVGAALGAAALASISVAKLRRGAALDRAFADDATAALTGALATSARTMIVDEDDLTSVTAEHFLFSFLCLVIDGPRALVFGVGDGLVGVDDALTVLDAGPENAPPYVGYRLVREGAAETRVHYEGPSGRRFLLATDGLAEWDAFAGAPLKSGGTQPSVRELARDPSLFDIPTRLQKRLTVVGQGHRRLHDDTTVVVVHPTQ